MIIGLFACTPLTTPDILTPQPPGATATIAIVSPTAPAPTPTDAPLDLHIPAGGIWTHPDPLIYSGDRVSFEVLVALGNGDVNPHDVTVHIYAGRPTAPAGEPLAAAGLRPFGISKRLQATMQWAWDTGGLTGLQTLTAWVDPQDVIRGGDEDPDNNRLTFTIDVRPGYERPRTETLGSWVTAYSACCVFHYTTNSAAERDITAIMQATDDAAAHARELLGVDAPIDLEINLINRVLGHNGFAGSGWIIVSYLDRNYIGNDLTMLLRHEMSHVLDARWHDYSPTMVTEGLAVVVAGGHYKPEAIDARMLGVLSLGRNVPLADLVENFREIQHEIGYLQAASVVTYLIDRYGWEGLRALYRNFDYEGAFQPGSLENRFSFVTVSDLAAFENALASTFDLSLDELEADWLDYLRAQPLDPPAVSDVAATLDFYDTVRRYQQQHDPSAYYLNAWIPNISYARQNQLIADYTRHPNAPENIALELMLMAADAAIDSGDYDRATTLLAAINHVLDADIDPAVDTLASIYYDLTRAVLAIGYEPQQITLSATDAQTGVAEVLAIRTWPYAEALQFKYTGSGWLLN